MTSDNGVRRRIGLSSFENTTPSQSLPEKEVAVDW